MKLYSLLAAALLCSTVAFGQRLGGNHNEEAGSVNTGVGIKAGLNIASTYDMPDGLETEGITSYHFGAYGKLGFGEKFGLQLEALYSRRGADFITPAIGAATKSEEKMRFDYIDVPLLLTYNIIGENTFTIMAGPQASLMMTAKEGDTEVDKDHLHTFDMGAAAGAQFGYKFLRIGARYNVGLRDVINTKEFVKENPGAEGYNFRNHFGQVYAAIEF